MWIYKYFSNKFCRILQKQAIFPNFCNQFGYWVTYYGGFGKNLTVFEKSELALFARAENQHNKKLKRRKEKNCQNIAIFQKILKKHVYQQIWRVGFLIVSPELILVTSHLLQVNFHTTDIYFVISVIKCILVSFYTQKTRKCFFGFLKRGQIKK